MPSKQKRSRKPSMRCRAEVRSAVPVSPFRSNGGFVDQLKEDLMDNLRKNATEDIKRRRDKGIYL